MTMGPDHQEKVFYNGVCITTMTISLLWLVDQGVTYKWFLNNFLFHWPIVYNYLTNFNHQWEYLDILGLPWTNIAELTDYVRKLKIWTKLLKSVQPFEKSLQFNCFYLKEWHFDYLRCHFTPQVDLQDQPISLST